VTGVWDLGRQSITGEDSRLLLDAPLACVFLGTQLLAFGPAVFGRPTIGFWARCWSFGRFFSIRACSVLSYAHSFDNLNRRPNSCKLFSGASLRTGQGRRRVPAQGHPKVHLSMTGLLNMGLKIG
jgi:hypothetical protein